jgi:hypothetical protein
MSRMIDSPKRRSAAAEISLPEASPNSGNPSPKAPDEIIPNAPKVSAREAFRNNAKARCKENREVMDDMISSGGGRSRATYEYLPGANALWATGEKTR